MSEIDLEQLFWYSEYLVTTILHPGIYRSKKKKKKNIGIQNSGEGDFYSINIAGKCLISDDSA